MLAVAAKEAYGTPSEEMARELGLGQTGEKIEKVHMPGTVQRQRKRRWSTAAALHRGDSVTVLPDGKIGIVVKPADDRGEVLVQVQKEKFLVSHKRLKLKVAAAELYPEDYDFSIVFDTVENRKARHKMGKGHRKGLLEENKIAESEKI